MNERTRQKKLARQKKRKVEARKQALANAVPASRAGLLRLATEAPWGPVWITSNVEDDIEAAPRLVSVVTTRRLRGGLLLPLVSLVDRTCLGVKNAFMSEPMRMHELEEMVAKFSDSGGPLERCEPLLALSVIWNAIDYARALGFEPNEDFEPTLVPRPTELLQTPLAAVARPHFISGPDDDVYAVVGQLMRAVGIGNFDVVIAEQMLDWNDAALELAEPGLELPSASEHETLRS
jgi:hypothetical protein